MPYLLPDPESKRKNREKNQNLVTLREHLIIYIFSFSDGGKNAKLIAEKKNILKLNPVLGTSFVYYIDPDPKREKKGTITKPYYFVKEHLIIFIFSFSDSKLMAGKEKILALS